MKLTKLIQGILEQDLGVDPGRCHCVVGICSSPSRQFHHTASGFQSSTRMHTHVLVMCFDQISRELIPDFVEVCAAQFQEQVHTNWGCGGDVLANSR